MTCRENRYLGKTHTRKTHYFNVPFWEWYGNAHTTKTMERSLDREKNENMYEGYVVS